MGQKSLHFKRWEPAVDLGDIWPYENEVTVAIKENVVAYAHTDNGYFWAFISIITPEAWEMLKGKYGEDITKWNEQLKGAS